MRDAPAWAPGLRTKAVQPEMAGPRAGKGRDFVLPSGSPLSVFWQSDYMQILPQEGEEGAHRADPAAEPLPEFFSTKSPVQTLKGV